MNRVRVASLALIALFVVAAISHAADKADKKKGKGVAGTVKSVDASAKSITLTMKVKKETSDKTFTVAEDAKVSINGEAKSLSDIEAGAKVQCKVSEDGQTVTAINIGKKKKKNA